MIELRNLRHVAALARTLNFSRAAADLGISQPALTRSIQSIEREVGLRLFDRDRWGVSVTPSGKRFAERAQQLIDDTDAFERELILTAQGQGGRLRFGAAPLPARALLAGALSQRLAVAPDLGNEVVVRNAEALWPMLVAGELEFFVAGDGQLPADLPVRAEVLGAFPVSLIVRKGHPLLTGGAPRVNYPRLMSSRTGETSGLLSARAEQSLGAIHVIEDFHALVSLTATSDAVWITTAYTVIDALREGTLEELPTGAPESVAEYRIIAYSHERRSETPAAKLMKAALRLQIRTLKRAYDDLPRTATSPGSSADASH